MSDKMIEAGAREMTPAEISASETLRGIVCDDAPGLPIGTLNRAAVLTIRAYLTALADDGATVERVARAVHSERQAAGYSGQAAWEYEPPSIHSLYIRTARAALDQVLDQSPP